MRLLTAGINQQYVVRISVREEHPIEVDAASAQEAEVKAWATKMLPTLEEHLKEAEAASRTGATN